MEKVSITKEQYERLLGVGMIHFYEHSIYLINWHTYASRIAMFIDARNDEKRLVELVVKE